MKKLKSCEVDSKVDRISNLPEHVIDQILCALPIKDAFRTSILSSKWRYRWATIPDLVFDNRVSPVRFYNHQLVSMNKLVEIVDRVLMLRSAPIHKFEINNHCLQASPNIDRWIVRLSVSPVEELILKVCGLRQYKMPSCLFRNENLALLKLSNCLLKPPTTFRGFHKLKTLDLERVNFSQDDFEALIDKCPLLESLRLLKLDCLAHLNIKALNLQSLDVRGAFDVILLLNTNQLTSVSIHMTSDVRRDQIIALRNSSKLQKFFDHFSQFCELVIGDYFLKYLAVLQLASSLSKPCKNLTYLSICIDFNEAQEILAMLHLVENSPNLENLVIFNESFPIGEEEEGFVERQTDSVDFGHLSMSFGKLRHVKINEVFGGKELQFIKLLLLNSPVLEKMILQPSSDYHKGVPQTNKVLKELLRFQRVSRAEVIFLDPKNN